MRYVSLMRHHILYNPVSVYSLVFIFITGTSYGLLGPFHGLRERV